MLTDYGKYEAIAPNDYYNELAQAFIDEQWDNGAAKTPENGGEILEQVAIGEDKFRCVEAWVKSTVGDVTTGNKDSRDFCKLYFRDIKHTCVRGQYYQMQNCFWIVNDYNHFSGIAQDVGIRRCNNVMRIRDPLNGGVFEIPCVVDYDMTSPSAQVGRYVITPNNHAIVKVQGNKDTLRLFKLNTRYMFGGRPFKLLAYQNALNYDAVHEKPTYLELDLYLDELHDGDDIEAGVAYNGDYDYKLQINAGDMHITPDSTGQFYTTVMFNGAEVSRHVLWSASNPRIIDVQAGGKYVVYGRVGDEAVITATLEGNPDVTDSITIKIEDVPKATPHIVLLDKFSKIRQNEAITFTVGVEYGGELHSDMTDVAVEMLGTGSKYIAISGDGAYTAICTKVKKTGVVEMRVSAKIATLPELDVEPVVFPIKTVSMFG